VSLSSRADGAHWLALHCRDVELSICYTAARLSSVRISRCAWRPSGVMGFGSPRSRAAASAMF
jgi:hypothetical protein